MSLMFNLNCKSPSRTEPKRLLTVDLLPPFFLPAIPPLVIASLTLLIPLFFLSFPPHFPPHTPQHQTPALITG